MGENETGKAERDIPDETNESNEHAQHTDFDPNIVTFCCHYCSYAAADLAGTMRLQYPTNIKILKIPCTGKVDILYLLKALEDGADGVIVAGCEEGSCYFVNGNIRAKKKVNYAKKILDEVGVGGERLEMFNLSAAMGQKFAEIVTEMTKTIKRLGPNPIKRGDSK